MLGFVGIVLAVPIAATVAVLVRYGVRYYEHTSFFGHESDADVVITPAMALIMPGVVRGAKIVHAGPDAVAAAIIEQEFDERATAITPALQIAPELGPSGPSRANEFDEVLTTSLDPLSKDKP